MDRSTGDTGNVAAALVPVPTHNALRSAIALRHGRDRDRPSGGPYLDSTTVYEHMTKLVGFNPVVIEMLNVITQQQRLMDVLRTWLNLRLLYAIAVGAVVLPINPVHVCRCHNGPPES
jgi:hypothetical protein